MKIVFTRHAGKKLNKLAEIGVRISRRKIATTVISPESVDKESDKPKMIASSSLDEKHILRVVFKIESDIITVITFYPARKGRYENKTSKN